MSDLPNEVVRPDGWPQATTVGYVNDGLNLYFLCGLPGERPTDLDGIIEMAETISRLDPAATALSSAMALASVPPLVKITVEAGAPIRPATFSRACSITARAVRPAAWIDDGLPTACITAVMAAMACGRTRVVALWSR